MPCAATWILDQLGGGPLVIERDERW